MTDETRTDYGYLAQQAAEQRLSALEALLDETEDWEVAEELLEPPLDAPYCGCRTCDVREILVAAWPLLLAAAREEVRLD